MKNPYRTLESQQSPKVYPKRILASPHLATGVTILFPFFLIILCYIIGWITQQALLSNFDSNAFARIMLGISVTFLVMIFTTLFIILILIPLNHFRRWVWKKFATRAINKMSDEELNQLSDQDIERLFDITDSMRIYSIRADRIRSRG